MTFTDLCAYSIALLGTAARHILSVVVCIAYIALLHAIYLLTIAARLVAIAQASAQPPINHKGLPNGESNA